MRAARQGLQASLLLTERHRGAAAAAPDSPSSRSLRRESRRLSTSASPPHFRGVPTTSPPRRLTADQAEALGSLRGRPFATPQQQQRRPVSPGPWQQSPVSTRRTTFAPDPPPMHGGGSGRQPSAATREGGVIRGGTGGGISSRGVPEPLSSIRARLESQVALRSLAMTEGRSSPSASPVAAAALMRGGTLGERPGTARTLGTISGFNELEFNRSSLRCEDVS